MGVKELFCDSSGNPGGIGMKVLSCCKFFILVLLIGCYQLSLCNPPSNRAETILRIEKVLGGPVKISGKDDGGDEYKYCKLNDLYGARFFFHKSGSLSRISVGPRDWDEEGAAYHLYKDGLNRDDYELLLDTLNKIKKIGDHCEVYTGIGIVTNQRSDWVEYREYAVVIRGHNSWSPLSIRYFDVIFFQKVSGDVDKVVGRSINGIFAGYILCIDGKSYYVREKDYRRAADGAKSITADAARLLWGSNPCRTIDIDESDIDESDIEELFEDPPDENF